jgi:hypothetical protein
LLGPDVNTNCGPAHFACGEVKTHTQDLPRIRKAKRQQARHEGTKKPARGFQGPAGISFDWKARRYITSTPEICLYAFYRQWDMAKPWKNIDPDYWLHVAIDSWAWDYYLGSRFRQDDPDPLSELRSLEIMGTLVQGGVEIVSKEATKARFY